MADPGFVDLIVRYRDPVTLEGVAVEALVGDVRNSIGTLIEVVDPVALSDADGVYYAVENYDIRDASKFFGTFITVEWKAYRFATLLPTFEKRYYYTPVADGPANKTVLYFLAPDKPNEILFYEIIRRRSGEDDVVAGYSFGPYFVDDHPFANEFEARSYQYVAKAYRRIPGEIQPDGTDYVPDGSNELQPAHSFRTNSSLCLIEGTIADLSRKPITLPANYVESGSVVFRMNWRDRHQIVQDILMSPEDVYAPMTNEGKFSMALLWDALVEIYVPFMMLKGRFIVPRVPRIGLSDLQMEILREK